MARGRVNFVWAKHPDQNLAVHLRRLNSSVLNSAVGDLALSWAAKGEAYAKKNRTWQDRTSHARDSLYGTAEGSTIYIGTVNDEYGIFLEVGTGRMRAYPIIMPTVQYIAPLYFADVVRMIRRYMASGAAA